MLIGRLTESLEDYLEIMYRLLQTQKVVRVRDIAREKDVKTSSVVSALRRLDKEGLVDYKAREYVDLTEEGRDLAFRVYQRHTFLKRFLIDFLQVDPATAEKDACSMEHAISLTTLERIASMSEFLSCCPEVERGLVDRFRDRWLAHLNSDSCECVKAAKDPEVRVHGDGEMQRLSTLREGEGGVVARIVADDEMRQPLIQRGVLPGASIHVVHRERNGEFEVRVSGERMKFDRRQSETILLWSRDRWRTGNGVPTDPSVSRTLADVTVGRAFRVRKVTADGEIRQRMVEMGFVRGAEGRILREALLRDPLEVELGGSRLSLRRVEAAGVIVEELGA
ncbi:MAG: Transcriptional regulator MntR [Calditrichaeota bacterium]|nr:Transcriptional regulator MntR [Calditrichota bacterium]